MCATVFCVSRDCSQIFRFNKSLEDAISPYEHKKVNGGNAKYGSEQNNIENLKL